MAKINTKIVSWILLYLASFIPAGLSILYFSQKSLLPALTTVSISMLIYTLLVIKKLRFLSLVSFWTLVLMSLITLGLVGDVGGTFSSALDEKAYMLTLPLVILFLFINSISWSRAREGSRKIISSVLIFLSVLVLVSFGTVSPDYYQNFVYTRISILVLLGFSVFEIIRKKRLLGISGILLSVGVLLLSTAMFADKVYTLGDQEQQEVIAFVDPLAKEMFDYYNQKDYDNFCKYCGSVLKNMLDKSSIKNTRNTLGPYTSFGKPDTVTRKGGRYYVVYPVKFKNVENLTYLTFVMDDISPNSSIYGFEISQTPTQ